MKGRKKKLDPIPVRLDPDVRAELDRIVAEDELRSLSGYINWVLKRHIQSLKRKEAKETKD